MPRTPCFVTGPAYRPTYYCQECVRPARLSAETPREVPASATLNSYPVCQQCYRVHTYMPLSWGAPVRGPVAQAQVMRGGLLRTDDRLGITRLWAVCEGCGHCDETTASQAELFVQDPFCEVCRDEMAQDIADARKAAQLRPAGLSVEGYLSDSPTD